MTANKSARIAALAMACAAIASVAYASPVSDRQSALSDVTRAQADLAQHHRMSAQNAIENAETTLLNADQSRVYVNTGALDSLENAHSAMLGRNTRQAALDLQTAKADLQRA